MPSRPKLRAEWCTNVSVIKHLTNKQTKLQSGGLQSASARSPYRFGFSPLTHCTKAYSLREPGRLALSLFRETCNNQRTFTVFPATSSVITPLDPELACCRGIPWFFKGFSIAFKRLAIDFIPQSALLYLEYFWGSHPFSTGSENLTPVPYCTSALLPYCTTSLRPLGMVFTILNLFLKKVFCP